MPDYIVKSASRLQHELVGWLSTRALGARRSQRYESALDGIQKALSETIAYMQRRKRGARANPAKEEALTDLWLVASRLVSRLPGASSLASACRMKGLGWTDPTIWARAEKQRHKIGINDRLDATTALEIARQKVGLDDDIPRPAPRKILFLSANPVDRRQRRLDHELREIRDQLQRSGQRDVFDLHSRGAVRPKDFVAALLDLEPAILHFSGHGAPTGAICMEDERGRAFKVAPQTMADLFEAYDRPVDCVLLNACFSKRQAQAIAAHVPFVIGIAGELAGPAAVKFATGFYRAIGANRSVREAFRFGLVELQLHRVPPRFMPVLVEGTRRRPRTISH